MAGLRGMIGIASNWSMVTSCKISAFEAVGRHARGDLTTLELKQIEESAIPGPGSCGGMYTANTMAASTGPLYPRIAGQIREGRVPGLGGCGNRQVAAYRLPRAENGRPSTGTALRQ